MKTSTITKTVTLCLLGVGGLSSTATAMQTVVNHGARHHGLNSMRVVVSHHLSRSHYSTVVPPHSVDLKEMKLTEQDLKSIQKFDVSDIEESKRPSQEVRTIHLPTLKIAACNSFSEDMKKFITIYDNRIREYGVIQEKTPFLYTNIDYHARESHKDLCTLIDWVEGDKYIGPNMIGRKYEKSLFDQQQISNYFKQRDTSFDTLPDDLKTLIFQMQENSEKMYGYINDLFKISDSRITKKFDVNLCLKTLKKIKPVLIKTHPDFNEYVKTLGGFLKEFDLHYRGEHYWKELPRGRRGGDFEYYDHLWYGMTGFEGPDGVPVKLTPELSAARETMRKIRKNIEIRHEQEDTKPFIEEPYIVPRSTE